MYSTLAYFSCTAPNWKAWVVDEGGKTEDISLGDAVDAIVKSVGPGAESKARDRGL